MFKYNSSTKLEVTDIFCLLCTSVISSINGWDMDYSNTELEEKDSIISEYYRMYHSLISGTFDYAKKEYTTGGLTVDTYMKDYHEPASRKYNETQNVTTDEESFAFLTDFEKFGYIFKNYLVAQVCNAMERKLLSDGNISEKDVRAYSRKFWSEFQILFKCKIDEFLINCNNNTELWIALYDYAVDMPNAIVGILKSLSSSDSTFFRYNKDNLDSIPIYIRSRVHEVKFNNFTDKFRIAGILVDAWKNYFMATWKGIYAGAISAGASSFIDNEGIIQYYNDVHDDMFIGGSKLEIPKFNELMSDIAKGSYWYRIGKQYYFNLIAWRQNEIRKKILQGLREDNELTGILGSMKLDIGKYLSARDISDNNGKANNDKTTKFDFLDKMISEVYYNFVDERHAKFFVDKWFKDFKDRSESEGKTDGKYPIDNKFKKERYIEENKKTYYNLIKGVNALKALESSVMNCGYSFMSFPIVSINGSEYELASNLSMRDYFNNDTFTQFEDEIDYDVDCGCEFNTCRLINNLQELDRRIIFELSKDKPKEKIKLGSITDIGIAFTYSDRCDHNLCNMLNEEGINTDKLLLDSGSLVNQVMDAISSSIDKSASDTFINIKAYYALLSEYNSIKNKNIVQAKALKKKLFMTQLRYGSKLISMFALNGDLTHGVTKEFNDSRKAGHADVNGNTVDILMLSLYSDKVTKDMIEDIYEHEVTDAEFEDMKKNHFVEQTMINNIMGSAGFSSSKNWYPNVFIKRNSEGKLVLDSIVQMFDELCSEIRISKNERAGLTMEKYLLNKNMTFIDLLKSLCKRCEQLVCVFSRIDMKEDILTLPRMTALGINLAIVFNHVLMLFYKLQSGIDKFNDVQINSNSDDFVDIHVLLNAMSILTQLDSMNNYTSKIDELSLYEEQYSQIFSTLDSVKSEAGFNRKSSNNYYDFVFMDNVEFAFDGYSDLDERLFQYRCVSSIVKRFVSDKSLWCIGLADKEYSLTEFVKFVKRVVSIKKESTNYEYHVDMISRGSLDAYTQNKIISGMKKFLASNPEYNEYSDSVWIDNIIQYCKSNDCKLSSGIISDMRVKINEYSISDNDAMLISLNGSVLHRNAVERNSQVIYFASAYGIFNYADGVVRECRGMNDFSWLC